MKNNIFKNNKINKSNGFTLVEAMFAIFILTFTITTFISVASSNLFAARYAKNEITANYLLQEVIDFMRNDRDTLVILQRSQTTDVAWNNFWTKYSICADETSGCYIDILKNVSKLEKCDNGDGTGSGCPFLYYDGDPANGYPFYTNDDGSGMTGKEITTFKRQLVVTQNTDNSDQLDIKVTVSWENGNLPVSRTMQSSLLKWQ